MTSEKKVIGDTTDCQTEEGITVSIIDTISFLLGLLAKRNLESNNVKEAIKDFQVNGKFNIGAKVYTLFISEKGTEKPSFVNGKRVYPKDERECCSNCGRRIEPTEKVWRTSDHKKLVPGTYKGKKAKMMAFDLAFYNSIYCTDCTAKFDEIISNIGKK